MSPELIAEIEIWAQSENVDRSEAIRQLLEKGLAGNRGSVKAPPAPPTKELEGHHSPRTIKARKPKRAKALPGG